MKPHLLMIAYACDPAGSGEHWLGWGWAEQAAHSCQVDLVTTPKARAAVEESSRAAGITPHFVSVPGWLRAAAGLGWAGWLRKLAWQRRVVRLAAELHNEKQFALAHQTTFHSFRAPFLAAGLGIPSVWGPIAGGEHVPPGFERYLGRAQFAESSRQLINRLWLQAPLSQTLIATGHRTFCLQPHHAGIPPGGLPSQKPDRPSQRASPRGRTVPSATGQTHLRWGRHLQAPLCRQLRRDPSHPDCVRGVAPARV